MKYLAIICLAGMLFTGQAYAQKFKPGFVVTQQGKKVTGFVKQSTVIGGSISCTFKTSEEGNPKTYTPHELKGYGYDKATIYEPHTVSFLDVVTQQQTVDTLFVEVLVKGKGSLYYFKDNLPASKLKPWQSNHHFYVQKDNGDLQELKIKGAYVYSGGLKRVKRIKTYLGTLNALFSDCPAAKSLINNERVQLRKHSLMQFISNYNQCTGGEQIIEGKSADLTSQLGLAVQYASSTIQFSGSISDRLNSSTSQGIAFGIYYLFSLDRNNRLFGQVELNYSAQKYAISHKDALSHSSQWDLGVMQVPIVLRYATSNPKEQLFVGAGINFDFRLSMKETLSESYQINAHTASIGASKENFRSTSSGIIIETGFLTKIGKTSRIELSVRYNRNAGFLLDRQAPTSIISFRVGLGF
ncbi:outer membrane beta-barrel protein [uncultured Microscilla sp.]|uniref:outer membrane beta-barrel protein n=1 Tax=uncultured Microscilla sp. TaxID=432653 RepID=UPI002627C953|nr:outer membrane beta-barrel protein [uncultured Microscilla sp.]